MPKRKLKAYNEAAWKEATNLERIAIWLQQPEDFELSVLEEQKMETLRQVWAVMISTMVNGKRMNKIAEMFSTDRRNAWKMMQEADFLFGSLLKTDKEAELSALKNRYYALADAAEQAGDFDAARKCLDSAQTVIQQIENMAPKRRQYTEIVFTSNPLALTAENGQEIDFEEIGVLEREAIAIPAGASAD